MALAISHAEGEVAVLDAVREAKPPFSPDSVVADFAAVLRLYHVHEITGDRWGGEFVQELFRKNGVRYEVSERTKSDIYKELLPLLNSVRVALLDSARLIAQLSSLERRTARGGRDSIDHPPGTHDDVVNAAAGALALAAMAPAPMVISDEVLDWARQRQGGSRSASSILNAASTRWIASDRDAWYASPVPVLHERIEPMKIPMPSPNGTNREGLFMQASGQAYDAAPGGKRGADRGRRGARDSDNVDEARAALVDALRMAIGDVDELENSTRLVDALVTACTGENGDEPADPGRDPDRAQDSARRADPSRSRLSRMFPDAKARRG